jgi:hypothetical protein
MLPDRLLPTEEADQQMSLATPRSHHLPRTLQQFRLPHQGIPQRRGLINPDHHHHHHRIRSRPVMIPLPMNFDVQTFIQIFPPGTRSIRTAEYLQAPIRRESLENALEILRKYDTVFVVDDSSSMRGKRWEEVSLDCFGELGPVELTSGDNPQARHALSTLADVTTRYDTDGIDICFLNHKTSASVYVSRYFLKRLLPASTLTKDIGCVIRESDV